MGCCFSAWHVTFERCYSNICILQGVYYKTSQKSQPSLTTAPVVDWNKTPVSSQLSRGWRLFVFPEWVTPLPEKSRHESKCETCQASKSLFVLLLESNFQAKLYLHMEQPHFPAPGRVTSRLLPATCEHLHPTRTPIQHSTSLKY